MLLVVSDWMFIPKRFAPPPVDMLLLVMMVWFPSSSIPEPFADIVLPEITLLFELEPEKI